MIFENRTFWIIEKQPKFFDDSRELYRSRYALQDWNRIVVRRAISLKVLRRL